MTQTQIKNDLARRVINLFLEAIEEDGLEHHKDTMERVDKFLVGYDGSFVELDIIADRLEKIGERIREETKSLSVDELELQGVESSTEVLGNKVSLRHRDYYDYSSDPQWQKYQEHIDDLKSKKKEWRESQKEREKKLKQDGQAEHTGTTKYVTYERS